MERQQDDRGKEGKKERIRAGACGEKKGGETTVQASDEPFN